MSNIYHISLDKRSNGNAGGVEKFAWYLEQSIGCTLLTPDESRRIQFHDGDILIGDGYCVEGADPFRFKVVSIVHGTWKEYGSRNGNPPFVKGEIERQHRIWNNPNIHKVAVSASSAYYATSGHNAVIDKVILNSVDTSLFKKYARCTYCDVYNEQSTSCECRHLSLKRPIIIYACHQGDHNKANNGLLTKIIERMDTEFEFRYLDAQIGEEHIKYAQGDMFLAPSRYEGNSYAALEAMASGLVPVVSNVGLFEKTDFGWNYGRKVAEIVDRDATVDIWCRAIRYAWARRFDYDPRTWICHNASLDIFRSEWQDYIKWLKDN